MLVSVLWCVQALGVCVCMFTSASVEVKLGFAQEDINLAAVFSLVIPDFLFWWSYQPSLLRVAQVKLFFLSEFEPYVHKWWSLPASRPM